MAGGRDESNIFFNKKDDDDGVIVREWMGPDPPIPTNLFIHTRQSPTLLTRQSLKIHDFK